MDGKVTVWEPVRTIAKVAPLTLYRYQPRKMDGISTSPLVTSLFLKNIATLR